MKPRVLIKLNSSLCDQPPYPENSPILISKDYDLGWIVEEVNDGEYEVQNFPFPGCKNQSIDFDLANDLSQGREIHLFC